MSNNKRIITAQHTEQLYAFTRKHFVEYYDLQTELVDHLANAIEAKWEQQPHLDFETALQQEFKKFGVFGFMDVVEQRQGALTKKYYKLLWSHFKGFFKLPKIVLTLAGIGITYQLLLLEPLVYMIILLGLIVGSMVRLYKLNRHYKKKVKQTGRRWLLEDIIFKCGGSTLYLYLAVQFLRLDISDSQSVILYLLASTIVVILIVYDYIVLFEIPSKAEEHLKATYPEYSMEIRKHV